MSRIMMRVGGQTRTLSLDSAREQPASLRSQATAWAGIPFEVHGLASCEPQGECGPIDGEIGLMIVTEGSYNSIVTVDGRDIQRTAGPGTIQFILGDERPNIRKISGRAQIVAMHFTSDWLRYTGIDAHALRGRLPIAADNARALASSMRAEVASGCPSGRLYAESLSIALVTFAYAQQSATSSPGYGPLRGPAKGRVERYMREHLERNLPLTELAALVGLGPRQFTDCFRRPFGTSPHRYLITLRLKEAATLLRCGRREISEVALSLGFSSQSHFTVAFRKYYGITPRQHVRGVQSNGFQ